AAFAEDPRARGRLRDLIGARKRGRGPRVTTGETAMALLNGSALCRRFGKRVEKGFTLIETMIVVAIIGILAAASIYIYNDYVVRARISEALAASAVARTAVIDNATSNAGDLSHGYPPPSTTENLDGIAIDSESGIITVDLSARA